MSLRLADQLCFSLYAASRAVTAAYAPLLAPLGLTYPQYLVMLVLWESHGVTVKSIGEALALDSGTLTPLLKRLEAQGLVTRARSTLDERALEVRLTSAGRKLERRAQSIPQKLVACFGLPLPELGKMRDELRKLARAASRAAAGELIEG
jgi:MarR family transcriptional regulator, organic hydroperoxide resistance regulator